MKTAPTLKIKAAVVQGEAIQPAAVTDLASLPGRPELYAKLLFVLQAPMQQLVIGAERSAARPDVGAGAGGRRRRAERSGRGVGPSPTTSVTRAGRGVSDPPASGEIDNGRTESAAGGRLHQGDQRPRALAAREDARDRSSASPPRPRCRWRCRAAAAAAARRRRPRRRPSST